MPEETLIRIRQHLETLKLLGIQKVLDQELACAAQQALPPTEVLERLLAIEANARIERRIERRIKESRLPERKLLSDFDFAFQTGVDKAQVLEIAKLDFVARKSRQRRDDCRQLRHRKKPYRQGLASARMPTPLPLSL